MTIEEKANRIITDIRGEKGTNPIRMFKSIAQKDYISIHGPEHHVLDGACLLMAFHNRWNRASFRRWYMGGSHGIYVKCNMKTNDGPGGRG